MIADIMKCPKCGGIADNGNDRCVPPNPYYCSKCETESVLETALMNAVKVEFNPEVHEFGMWCGDKESAQAILDAANSYIPLSRKLTASEAANKSYHTALGQRDAKILELEAMLEARGA